MTNFLTGQTLVDSLEISDEALAEINVILEDRRNFSMSMYKDKCMKRRVAIRMRSCRCDTTTAYCSLLQDSEKELDLLKKTLTIHVSHFFRNPSMFNQLQTVIFPYLFTLADTSRERFRCLSLGCSSGEEPYSLGIILQEYFAREHLHASVDIHAYDIDSEIIAAAIKAEYNQDRLKELPDFLKERYFSQTGSRMQLSARIREMVAFHQQNIMEVGMIEPCQLVLCRNTLIYFTRTEQEKILHGIAHILMTGGILVLGKSEALVGEARRLFASVCPTERIYRRL
ncbi:MAG: protein-glutamate O-methyltransferase CheR [Desulfuromonadaceae bacterium]|nr:protein-glutamate O-methyltransferase CheR [Desulfuromonadaceae bacterium]